MSPETRSRSAQDSFADVLHSEIASGNENLTAWIKQVQEQGSIESLFQMETWIKGLCSFFRMEHLPLSPAEKGEIVTRSFAPELAIVRQVVVLCESCACEVLRLKTGDKFEFEDFLDNQMRKDRLADFHIARLVEQRTPRDSVSQFLEFLNDFRVTLDAFNEFSVRDYQLFLSLGRALERELKNCRYIDMLLSQRFRMQYDFVETQALGSVLRSIPEDAVRRNFALALLFLFRFLKYLELVAADLKLDRSLKHHLVVFALLHEEIGVLSDFLRARFLKGKEPANTGRNAAELVAYSLKTEAQRVLDRELVFMSRESDPVQLYTRMENSHGLLRSCCQSGILALIQSIDKSFDATVLFPSRADSLISAEKVRQDLWDLRQWLSDVSSSQEELDSNKIIERLSAFKDHSLRYLMYRDWAEFEGFSDALAIAANFIEIRTHIRKFVHYLEMLIQEVSKRSVFHDKPPNP
jgi:hypothetical protein